MPLKRCTIKNRQGWKFGEQGKCYVGKMSKEKALKQGRAIKMSQKKNGLQ